MNGINETSVFLLDRYFFSFCFFETLYHLLLRSLKGNYVSDLEIDFLYAQG